MAWSGEQTRVALPGGRRAALPAEERAPAEERRDGDARCYKGCDVFHAFTVTPRIPDRGGTVGPGGTWRHLPHWVGEEVRFDRHIVRKGVCVCQELPVASR
jgi:hypothetical protein